MAPRLVLLSVAAWASCALGLCAAPALAAELLVAQVAPLKGDLASYTLEIRAGIQALFDRVNYAGGIRGDRLKLLAVDDNGDPATAIAQIERVAASQRPLAFMYLIGPETVELANQRDVFARVGVPLIGTSPAAYQLRKPLRAQVFHVAQGEDAEYAKLGQQLRSLGLRKVAVVHTDDAATLGELRLFEQVAAAEPRLQITERVSVAAGKALLDAGFETLAASQAEAIISMLPVGDTARALKKLRQRGRLIPFYGASYNEAGRLFDDAGEAAARGTAVSQVVPNPYSGSLAVARDYQADMKRFSSGSRLGTLSFEGYLAAKILVEALSRAAPPLTAAALRQSLETRGPFDLGGIKAQYTKDDHVGLDFVDIGIVTFGGRLQF